MSQAACFRTLPQASCAANFGHESLSRVGDVSSSSVNKFLPGLCIYPKRPARRTPHSGLRLRTLSRNFMVRARRSVVTCSAASDRMRGTASFERVCDCLVYPSLDQNGRTKGVIHFIGGAFIGAAPDVIYSVLIELLAKEGYLIVATPFSLSFDHTVSAQGIHTRFNTCLDYLSNTGFAGLSAGDISTLPVYSVGHSLGALMQVVIGSTCSGGRLPKASALISFNNKPASDAVPFFDQMGPTLAQVAPIVESSPATEFARAFSSEAIRAVLDSRVPLPPAVGDNLQSFRQFLDQIPAVFDQVSQGVSEFTPTPAQNRAAASLSYAVPNNLLVKFTQDAIDETDVLEEILGPRSEALGGKLTKVVLTGNHLTPVAPDVKWQAGREYTPADAVAQVLRNVALADLRVLSRNIADWFSSL
ncbi:uncharacterized protein [Physcomitrium patens]|uniref:Uncharacterized protein n=1 Tax=Physcomitrium patens TaxID=3218 RepID=A0A2K1LBE8_PHYPA|nr:uncharacterized protein LOC112285558 [Physcomitrium patens]PNR63343.1 hypothetical protein PHYPA_001768 [Physcomitrium patens]|eukprot:XP_024382279.1 uncharacterized protein LOC112285558 [Physcomitrella patens]